MTKSKPADIFLIAGGPKSRNNKAIIAEALALSKTEKHFIAYIGAASSDNKEFFSMLRQMLISAGAVKVTLVPIVQGFDRKKAESILSSGDFVFISGGDVKTGMEYLEKRNLVQFLRKLYKSGKPFFGISAGAIMLCRNWMHWRDPDDDDTVELLDCLGFTPPLCDVHAEEDDWAEMKRLLGFFPQSTVGYGIPTGGALLVTPDGAITSLGTPTIRFVNNSL